MKGLDVGTSYIIMSQNKENGIDYKEFRDAYYVIKPTTPVAVKMIEKGLQGKVFIKDTDNSFIILGKDAIEKAIERNDLAKGSELKASPGLNGRTELIEIVLSACG